MKIKKQIYYLIKSEIYLGQISGPFFSKLSWKNDNYRSSNFQSPIIFKKFVVITKVFENGIQLNLKDIYNEKLECVWDNKILKLNNIEFLNNSSDEILEASKELLNKENVKNEIDIQKYYKENGIKLKHSNFSIWEDYQIIFKNNKLIN